MEINNIQELHDGFTQGKLSKLPTIISIAGVEYKFLSSTAYPLHVSLADKTRKPMVIYVVKQNIENMERFKKQHTNSDDPKTFQDHIVLVWANVKLSLKPTAVRFVPKARLSMMMVREAEIEDDRIIGNKIDIVLSGFNNNSVINAKVDTGAVTSSLDANNVNINKEQKIVSFSFGDKRVTMPLLDKQAVKTADNGVEYRPVVEFNVMLPNSNADKQNRVLKKIQFNLNDRSGMPDKILLGQNFIKAGDFVIMDKGEEKKVIESVDWDVLQEEYADVEGTSIDNSKIIIDLNDQIEGMHKTLAQFQQ